MNFFKSVFADESDSPESKSEPGSPRHEDLDHDSPPKQAGSGSESSLGAWGFGGLMKTLATRSESVLETYRRDLKEFGTGLRKEIEVAHGSLENVGHAIDEFGNTVLKGTAQIITQGKEAILVADNESDSSSDSTSKSYSAQRSLNSKRYSRFEAQVRAIQGDINTYCEEPEDLGDYSKWKVGFDFEEKKGEIEKLLEENGTMRNFYKRVVPNSADHETFWCRYFYRVFKLRQAEDLRANLVKRAISREEEEELSWDVDDEEEEDDEKNIESRIVKKEEGTISKDSDKIVKAEKVNADTNSDLLENKESKNKDSEETVSGKKKSAVLESHVANSGVSEVSIEKTSDVNKDGESSAPESSADNVANVKVYAEKNEGLDKEDSLQKNNEKAPSEGKADIGESSSGTGKDSDFSVVSSQPSMPEEEDLGWDEIEDLSSIDDKKVTHVGSPAPSTNRADLRKRLSAAEEEEDLSWDIEDDDEPVKA